MFDRWCTHWSLLVFPHEEMISAQQVKPKGSAHLPTFLFCTKQLVLLFFYISLFVMKRLSSIIFPKRLMADRLVEVKRKRLLKCVVTKEDRLEPVRFRYAASCGAVVILIHTMSSMDKVNCAACHAGKTTDRSVAKQRVTGGSVPRCEISGGGYAHPPT